MVELLTAESDDIAGWPAVKRATLPARVVWSRDGARTVRRAVKGFRPTWCTSTTPSRSSARRPFGPRTARGCAWSTLHNFRPLCPAATFLRDGRVCEDCLGRVPVPAVVHGCYRGSRAATFPVAAKDALHSAIGTWSSAVDTYITPSEFARSRYVKAGWPAERIAVKYNTAPDPGTPRPAYGGGFLCLSRLYPEKGVDLLLDAWERAFPGGGERLRIVGSGELEPSCAGAPSRWRASSSPGSSRAPRGFAS